MRARAILFTAALLAIDAYESLICMDIYVNFRSGGVKTADRYT